MKTKTLITIVLLLSILGVLDASYLTFEYYSDSIPPCSTSPFVDCGKVLKSQYAVFLGFPVSMMGLAFYSTMAGLMIIRLATRQEPSLKEFFWRLVEKYARPRSLTLSELLFYAQLVLAITAGAFSAYFVYLQVGVIGAICLYCMLSALTSFSILGVSVYEWMKRSRQGNMFAS